MSNRLRKVTQESLPAKGTSIWYILENYGTESICDGDKWSKWTEGDRKEFPEMGTFEKSRIENLKRELQQREKRGTPAKEINWKAFMMWNSECKDREEKFKLEGLKRSLEEVQDKFKM